MGFEVSILCLQSHSFTPLDSQTSQAFKINFQAPLLYVSPPPTPNSCFPTSCRKWESAENEKKAKSAITILNYYSPFSLPFLFLLLLNLVRRRCGDDKIDKYVGEKNWRMGERKGEVVSLRRSRARVEIWCYLNRSMSFRGNETRVAVSGKARVTELWW